MFTKIAFVATAAAILLSTASVTVAAPKNQPAAKSQQIPEPLYFKHATGEEGL